MGYFIVTGRSLLWMLTGLTASLLMLGALASPVWLVAAPEAVHFSNNTIVYNPSVGVYAQCCKPLKSGAVCTAMGDLSTDSHIYPSVWKAASFFLIMGLTILSLTVCMSLISCCSQSIFKKSIFTVSGAIQAFAGICFIIGVMLQPMGWGAARVVEICGKEVSPFYPGDCTLGLGLALATAGTVLTFLSACLSVPAENSTSSDRVQDQIFDGHTLICLM